MVDIDLLAVDLKKDVLDVLTLPNTNVFFYVFLYMAAAGGWVWSLDRACKPSTAGVSGQNVGA